MGCGSFQNEDIKEKKYRKKKYEDEEDEDEDEENEKKKQKEKNKNKIKNMNEEELKNYLDKLYKSYYAAKTYFCSNDFKEKEVDAIKQCKIIISSQELIKQGKYKEIIIDELPEEITPEYITGYTVKQKKKKIQDIINILQKEKEEANKRQEKNLENLKKQTKNIKKENIEKFKEESKKILSVEKDKIDLITKDIEAINNILKYNYMPIPEYIIHNEEYQKEKVINEDIPEYTLRISVNELSYTKSNPLIIINLISRDNIIKSKEIKGKSNKDISDTFDWIFNENDYTLLLRNKMEIILKRTYMMKSDKIKGNSEISLRNLKNRDTVGGSIHLKMESGKNDENIDVTIKIRSPLLEKEYETSYREVLKITKLYPEFNVDGDNYNYSSKKNQIKLSVNRIFKDIESKEVNQNQE